MKKIKHDTFCSDDCLRIIYQHDAEFGTEVVIRWCAVCGAVVGDLDYDGRTKPGQIFHMQFPADAKSRYELG